MSEIRLFLSIFRTDKSLFLAVLLSFFILSVVVWFPQVANITLVLGSGLSLVEKIYFIGGVYASLLTVHSTFSAASLIVLSILFGLHGALTVHYIQTRQQKQKTKRYHALSTMGFVAGLLGVGCAACGSIILTALATSLGVGGLFVLLPWSGQEFTLIGIGMLLISMHYLLRNMLRPQVCDIV